MTAITQRLLHPRRPHLYSLHRFSSTSASDIPPQGTEPEPEPRPKPSFSSYFSDVRATLQREPPPQNLVRKPPSSSPPHSKSGFFEEIRRNLAENRSRSAPPPPSSTSGQYSSLQEIHRRNVISKDDDSATSSSNSAIKPPVGRSFDAIKQSLFHLRADSKNQSDSGGKTSDRMSLSRFREGLNVNFGQNGGGDNLPSFSGKEKIGGEHDNVSSKSAMRTVLLKMYSYSDLGRKLKVLRPEKKKGNWFSLHELNERLAKLKEMEEKESRESVGGVSWRHLRETMVTLSLSEEEKAMKRTMQRLDILGQFGGTPSYLLSDPKDRLVEKYFHPDNMSSAEKLKLELKKVRDEFKMSESDCGSARVQVALLTTKIKHLSSVLHKKDKHSRRGLQAMVQRRKKLLKYLRRTDWDSYCLVLSKLGLRDSPEFRT